MYLAELHELRKDMVKEERLETVLECKESGRQGILQPNSQGGPKVASNPITAVYCLRHSYSTPA